MWGEREEYIPFLSDFFLPSIIQSFNIAKACQHKSVLRLFFKKTIAIALLSDMFTNADCNA